MYKLAVASAALIGAAFANEPHNGKNCHDIKVPVTVDTTLKQFDYTPTDKDADTTNFFLGFTRHDSDFLTRIVRSVRLPVID